MHDARGLWLGFAGSIGLVVHLGSYEELRMRLTGHSTRMHLSFTFERSAVLATVPLLRTRASLLKGLARFQCRVEKRCEGSSFRR